MNDADKKLLELAEKATPRPWRIQPYIDEEWNERQLGIYSYDKPLGTAYKGNAVWLKEGESEANAAYITAAANAVPRLIAEKEALLKALRQIRNCQFNGIVAMNIAEEALAADAAAAKEPSDD